MENAVFEFVANAENTSVILLALAVAGARPLGFVLLCPIFSRYGVQEGIVRGGVLLALTLPGFPVVTAEMTGIDITGPFALIAVIAKEMLVGLVLGLISGLPFWAAATAGDFIDMSRGASMGNLIDPGSGSETSVTGTFLFLICVLYLISAGVFMPALFGPLFDSYRIYPVFEALPPIEALRASELLVFLGKMTSAGLILALPLVLPFVLLDSLLGVAGKYVQQLNTMFLSMSIKQGVFALLMLIYTGLVTTYAFGNFGRDSGSAELLRVFFGVNP